MPGTVGAYHALRMPVWTKALIVAGLFAVGVWMVGWSEAQSPATEIVAEVTVEGNRRIATERILRGLGTVPGREYSRAQLQQDVAAIGSTRLFKNVGVREEVLGDGRIRVVFLVQEYPNLIQEVVYKHAKHLSDKDLENITGLRKGMSLDPVTAKTACFKIQDALKEKGYYFANVVLEEGDKATDQRVVFNITEGPKLHVRKIAFQGNHELATAARLNTQIDSSRSFLGMGGIFNPRLVDSDVQKL
ncbi:MAG: hypothetical protein NZO58_06605, partial [Gemmataceae bacterium]|nr:hypothetical protein [Gemmataceae bacterium]